MKRADITYGQLDTLLRTLGFTCRLTGKDRQARRSEHAPSGAIILLHDYPKDDNVFAYHLVMLRTILDNFGVLEPSVFDDHLAKAD